MPYPIPPTTTTTPNPTDGQDMPSLCEKNGMSEESLSYYAQSEQNLYGISLRECTTGYSRLTAFGQDPQALWKQYQGTVGLENICGATINTPREIQTFINKYEDVGQLKISVSAYRTTLQTIDKAIDSLIFDYNQDNPLMRAAIEPLNRGIAIFIFLQASSLSNALRQLQQPTERLQESSHLEPCRMQKNVNDPMTAESLQKNAEFRDLVLPSLIEDVDRMQALGISLDKKNRVWLSDLISVRALLEVQLKRVEAFTN